MYCSSMAGNAQSVRRLARGWMVRGSNSGRGKIFCTCPDRPWGPLSLPYNGYRVFPRGGGLNDLGVVLPTHPLLVPISRKSRAIPLTPSGPSGLLWGTFTFYCSSILTFLLKYLQNVSCPSSSPLRQISHR
jgi:hypothetical protein